MEDTSASPRRRWVHAVLFGAYSVAVVMAAAVSANAQITQTAGGDRGLFAVPTAYTAGSELWLVSASRTNLDRNPGDLDVSLHAASVARAIGRHRRLLVFGNVSALRVRRGRAEEGVVHGLEVRLPAGQTWATATPGDISLGSKWSFLDDRLAAPVAVAARTAAEWSVAPSASGLRRSGVLLSADVVATRMLGMRGFVTASLGVEGIPSGRSEYSACRWGLGASLRLASRIDAVGETRGWFGASDRRRYSHPIDAVAGMTIRVTTRLWIRPGLSSNLRFGGPPGTGWRSHVGLNVALGYGLVRQ